MKHYGLKLVGVAVLISSAGFTAGTAYLTRGSLPVSPGAPGGVTRPWNGPRPRPTPVPELPVSSGYIDGAYTGRRESAYYGTVQVEAVIQGGDLVDVRILSYPNDNGISRSINRVALPRLIRESLQEQGARVAFVTGATFTSEAYFLSLRRALRRALGA